MSDDKELSPVAKALRDQIKADLTSAYLKRDLAKSVRETPELGAIVRPAVVFALHWTQHTLETYRTLPGIGPDAVAGVIAELALIESELIATLRDLKDPLDSAPLTEH